MHRKYCQGNQALAAGAWSLEQDEHPMVSQVRGTRVCRTRRYAHIPRTLQYQRKIFGAEWMEVLEPCWTGIAYRHNLPGHPDLPRMRDKRLICLAQGTVKMEFRERNTTIEGLSETIVGAVQTAI